MKILNICTSFEEFQVKLKEKTLPDSFQLSYIKNWAFREVKKTLTEDTDTKQKSDFSSVNIEYSIIYLPKVNKI